MSSAGQQLVAGRIPGERIATASRTSASSAIGGTETQIDSITAALVSGRTYRVTWDVSYTVSATASTDHFFARIREDNTSGTQLQGCRLSATTTAQSYRQHVECEYTAVATGNKTFSLTFIRTAGAGTVTSHAAATNPTYAYVDYIRG